MLSNLRSMAIFATLVEQGSFSAAARELGITTSAVSQQISNLEKLYNVKLITRQTRKIQLTEAGRNFFIYCQQIVQAAQQGQGQLLACTDSLRGTVSIASTPEVASLYIAPVLKRWAASHPLVTLSILCDNQFIDLEEKNIDIAVRISRNPPAETDHIFHLRTCRPIVCSSPRYLDASTKIVHPADVQHHPLLCLDPLRNNHVVFRNLRTGQTEGVHLEPRYFSNNLQILKTMAELGYGLLYILDQDVAEKLKTGELVELLKDWVLPYYTMYLEVSPKAQPDLTAAVITLLQQNLVQHSS